MAPVATHVKKFIKKKKFKPKLFKHQKKKSRISDEIKSLRELYPSIDSSKITHFTDLPLSKKTQKGLKESEYEIPTEIQRESVAFSLQGEDILGAAETGSGKTLAFLIPVLETLYCKQWTNLDGLGALIITPTRELAYQIFETLKKIGKYHDFSAALIIGGKDLYFEQDRMHQCNIIICTPGRILHHMDMNPLFDCTNMQILVLDEADRCLDLGFQETMNSIIENLPKKRQTLLFSATQTKSVKDLARLSLKSPKYVAVHEHKKHSTPDALEQSYIVCELHDKIKFIWSFIKNHRKQKIIIFLSSCKQVKYIYLLFCRMRPGSPLLALYGTLKQLRRMAIYRDFCAKSNVVMFATDIAARGLDFPDVNWVVQLDCPEDSNTYIHRAGRTARYQKNGESLLVLLPSEEKAMLKELEEKKIPINNIKVNTTKLMSPQRKIEALLARDPNLKADAQRAFVAYIKWVFLMKNKDIFNVNALDLEQFASSFGLPNTPRVRFLKGKTSDPAETRDNELDAMKNITITESSGSTSESEEDVKPSTEQKWDESDDEMNFLTLKRRDHDIEGMQDSPEPLEDIRDTKKKKKAIVTKASIAKKILKKKIVANKKTVFDEEGEAVLNKGKEKVSKEAQEYEMENQPGIDIEKAKAVIKAEDKFDKKLFRERVKEKHKGKKRKLKKEKEEDDEAMNVQLGSGSEGSEPDVSWLPDPDKVYGKKDGNEDEVEFEKTHQVEAVKRKSKKKKTEDFSTGLSLADHEELALRLLRHIGNIHVHK